MPTIDISSLGTAVLCAVLVASGCAFAIAVVSGRGRSQLLPAARNASYATCALVATAVGLLAYAFQAHDFRIRYVARYSDRSMPWNYLVTALWGGQDGSLLWWCFLVSVWTFLATRWLKSRHVELAPYILATLMSIIGFFAMLMLFAANPFSTSAASVPLDGEGLNPLLQNYWMMIHPPTLYMGFVGWSVPFAIVVAALVTGRLKEEWIFAARKWALAAWTFLAFGNLLGGLWSYEELGWGGYWAWDPVENAAFMPLLVGTAYLHSVMIQERRGMLKVWNVFLLCLTFIMTIFGTFLTRSGLIASVHSFARSDIGIYFAWYLLFLCVVCLGLIFYRLPLLRAENKIDSMLSREFFFLLQNWVLLGMMLFVLIATTFPLISEWVRGETVTVGPGYYNKWMVPLGLVLMLLTGIGPLISWRRATGRNLMRAFLKPTLAAFGFLLLQIVLGGQLGYPAYVQSEAIYDTTTGKVLAAIYGASPGLSVLMCTFVLGTILQEFWRGTAVRRKNAKEGVLVALVELVSRAKRRYGGYIVHAGLVSMYFGFTGAAYDVDKEAALKPGQSLELSGYQLRYDSAHTEVDPNKSMLFTELTVLRDGEVIGHVSPAKFRYRTHPEMPTTEVAIRSTLRDDIYVIMSQVNPETQLGVFRVIVRPLVAWIWIGGLMLLFGAFVAISPSVAELLESVKGPLPSRSALARPALATLLLLSVLTAVLLLSTSAFAQESGTSSLMAGTVAMKSPEERKLFDSVLCQCGGCARLPLSGCVCHWAEEMRTDLRGELASGKTVPEIQKDYAERFGVKAIAIPRDKGLDRALWAVPIAGFVLAAGGLAFLGRRWVRRNDDQAPVPMPAASPADSELERALDEELRKRSE
ncbi:MAG: Cytochrome c heme lyase subunit CcmF [Myxococcaceae bacterium]|nr:Cytochrome c heme lyase subunit CcmF [Myxococcaceae bacterium]